MELSTCPVKDKNRPLATASPLCVDLDGTLVRTDTLIEGALALLRGPAGLRLPGWLLCGRAWLKDQVAAHSPLDVTLLPYEPELVEYLKVQREMGRKLVLATAANRRVATQVAEHLGLFDEVVASDERTNLKGNCKSDLLRARFGAHGFDYAGDSVADLPVWEQAGAAILVNPQPSVRRALRRRSLAVRQVFEGRQPRWRAWAKALRVHQWTKNLLVFVPLLLAHRGTDPGLVAASLISFAALNFCASSVYITNDLLDLDADRRHAHKRLRPFAAGDLPVSQGLVAIPLLLAAAFGLALLLPLSFCGALALYLTVTSAYSFWLKRVLLIDVLVLSGLYTLRLAAGAGATHIVLSPWTLAFSGFLFLSLALVKRYAELHSLAGNEKPLKNGRAYLSGDATAVSTHGVAAGYLAALVLALYVNSPEVKLLYHRPEWLWLICPLVVYWIARVWMLAGRGQLNEDPVVFALRDRASYAVGLLALTAAYLAS